MRRLLFRPWSRRQRQGKHGALGCSVPPDGGPVGEAFKTRDVKVGDIAVVLVEVVGTYVGGMGGSPTGPERPNYMLLGAIAQGPDANWFIRATGPRATLEAQRAAFEDMIRSLKQGQ